MNKILKYCLLMFPIIIIKVLMYNSFVNILPFGYWVNLIIRIIIGFFSALELLIWVGIFDENFLQNN